MKMVTGGSLNYSLAYMDVSKHCKLEKKMQKSPEVMEPNFHKWPSLP